MWRTDTDHIFSWLSFHLTQCPFLALLPQPDFKIMEHFGIQSWRHCVSFCTLFFFFYGLPLLSKDPFNIYICWWLQNLFFQGKSPLWPPQTSVYLIFDFSKAFQTQDFLIIFPHQLGPLPICLSEQFCFPLSLLSQKLKSQPEHPLLSQHLIWSIPKCCQYPQLNSYWTCPNFPTSINFPLI